MEFNGYIGNVLTYNKPPNKKAVENFRIYQFTKNNGQLNR